MRWIPLLWRYLLFSYLRIFFLSVFSFVGLLFVLRCKDIARFACLSGEVKKTWLFIVYQFPHILPVAIPISALIASFLLMHTFSQHQEFNACRTSGVSPSFLLKPVLHIAFFFALCNFAISAEVAPYCRRETKTLLFREKGINPLILLQRPELAKIKNTYLEWQQNVIGITYNAYHKRLQLFTAETLSVEGEELRGKHLSLLSHIPHQEGEDFDETFLENLETMTTSASQCSLMLKQKRPVLEPTTFSLKHLLVQRKLFVQKAPILLIEILRRFSQSASVWTLSLLGCAFGIQTQRKKSVSSLLQMVGLTLFIFTSYFLGKSLKSFPLAAFLALALPHPILWLISYRRLALLSKGKTG